MNISARVVCLAGILIGLVSGGLFAETEQEPWKPVVAVSKLPNQLSLDQNLTWTISFKWKGKEEDFRFLIPTIPTSNLNLIRVGQVSRKEGSDVLKRFNFILQPEKTGSASIHNFPFRFESAETKTISEAAILGGSLSIQSAQRDWYRQKKFYIPPIAVLGGLIVFFLKALFRRKEPSDSSRLKQTERLEEKILRELETLNPENRKLDDFIDQLSKIFDQYLLEKWGSVDRTFYRNLPALERSKQNGIFSIFDQLERMKFAGRLNQESAESLKKEIGLFIETFKIIEP